jgi:hypothetical protein
MLIAAGARLDPAMADWEGSDEFMAVIDDALSQRDTATDRMGR